MKYRSFDYPGSGGTAGGYDSIYCRPNRLRAAAERGIPRETQNGIFIQ